MSSMMSLSDVALVRLVQEGNNKPFNVLMNKYQRRIESLVNHWVDNRSDTLDIVQDTFFRAYRGIHQFRGDSAFYSWLYRIAQNSAKSHLMMRVRHSHCCSLEDFLEETEVAFQSEIGSPEHLMMCEQLQRKIEQSINALPMSLQKVIWLRDFQQMSYDEMALKLHCPIGTVRSRLFRARGMIDRAIRPLLLG